MMMVVDSRDERCRARFSAAAYARGRCIIKTRRLAEAGRTFQKRSAREVTAIRYDHFDDMMRARGHAQLMTITGRRLHHAAKCRRSHDISHYAASGWLIVKDDAQQHWSSPYTATPATRMQVSRRLSPQAPVISAYGDGSFWPTLPFSMMRIKAHAL